MLLLSRKPHDFFLPDFSPLALLSTSMPGWRLHLGKHGGASREILLGAGGHMSAEPVVLIGLLWVRGNPGRVIIYIWPTPKPTRALNTGPTPLISEAQSWPTRKARPSTVPDLRCFYSSLLQHKNQQGQNSPLFPGATKFLRCTGSQKQLRKQAGEDLNPGAREDRGLASDLDLKLETAMWELPPTVIIPVVITV